MTISSELFLAILSMDSYNRGYGAGIGTTTDGLGSNSNGSVQIGTATLTYNLEDAGIEVEAQAAGFYAVAYTVNGVDGIADGTTVISYRGTDNASLVATSLQGASDILTGWISGAGQPAGQSRLAFDFFTAVTEDDALDGEAGGVVLTGHSLGGGLAGLVASLSGDEAVVFDNMPYALVATIYALGHAADVAGETIASLFGGTAPGDFNWPTASNIHNIYLDGEALEYARALSHEIWPLLSIQFPEIIPLSLIVEGNALAMEIQETTTELPNYLDFSNYLDPVGLHSQQLKPIYMFGDSLPSQDWHAVAPQLFSAWFNKDVAEAILGVDGANMAGAADPQSKLRYILAYSILDTGHLPFGDVAIRAMFNDANDLGQAIIGSGASDSLRAMMPGLAELVVQYAGLTGFYKLFRHQHIGIESGIVTLSTGATEDYAGVSQLLSVNLDRTYWGIGSGTAENPADTPFAGRFVGMDSLFASFFSRVGGDQTGLEIDVAMRTLWGPLLGPEGQELPQANRFNAIHIGLDAGPQAVRLPDSPLVDANGATITDETRASIFVSGDGDDRIAGSNINDFIVGGAGADTMLGGAGRDLLVGGAGDDLFIALPGMINGQIGGGDDGDVYIGGQPRDDSWLSWLLGFRNETDTVRYLSGEQAPELFERDADTGEVTAIERAPSRDGLTIDSLEVQAFGDAEAILVHVTDGETGRSAGDDFLISVERIDLSDNRDHFIVSDASLDAEIVVDLGTSRRLAGELAEGDTLDDDAFMQNLDILDYSGVTRGIIYANGATAERDQGLLVPGGSSSAGLADEMLLLTGHAGDNLHVEGADSIILTNQDDVLVSARLGSIVELGDGADKVWLQPGVLVRGFDADDRLTLFGTLGLFGGIKWKGSDTPYVTGFYGVRYAINTVGDLLVTNPWMADSVEPYMYIEGWRGQENGKFLNIPVGPGNILLAEISIQFYHFFREGRPSVDNEISLFDTISIKMFNLTGDPAYGKSDPLVFDLDGDGIELAWLAGVSRTFDADNDLYREPVAFAAADDGVLARDIDGDGRINNGGELFGHGAVSGLDVLATLDGNHDGRVDAADDGLADFNGDGAIDASDVYAGLLIWRDLNGDRISQANELQSAVDLGIVAINVPEIGVSYDDAGNPIVLATVNGSHLIGGTTFERADGSTSMVGEVLFAIDDRNTRYDGPSIAILAEAAAGPELRGYGTLNNFQQALSFLANDLPATLAAALERIDHLGDLLQALDNPDPEALAVAARPIAHLWASTAPWRNAAGDIVTGVAPLPDLPVIRNAANEIVDYVWGGTRSVGLDADGHSITTITLGFGSGEVITYRHSSESGHEPALAGWRDLFDAMFGTGDAYAIATHYNRWSTVGADGAEITRTGGFVDLDVTTDTEGGLILTISPEETLDWISGADLSFFSRYSGQDLSVLFEPPADDADAVGIFNDVLELLDTTMRHVGVVMAVQAGPLSVHFSEIAYDVATGQFHSTNPARQLGGVFESLIESAAIVANPIGWLANWEEFLNEVIGYFDRGEGFLNNNNPFLVQNIVNGHEGAQSTLDLIEVAVALGVPREALVSGTGEVAGTYDIDIFYLNGDETLVTGGSGMDSYIVAGNVGNVVIDDTVFFDSRSDNQIRFAVHTADEIEASVVGENLILTVRATGETITVVSQFRGEWPGTLVGNAWFSSGVGQIVFADGETWDEIEITKAVSRIDPASTTVTGTEDTDYIQGGAGNDRLEGSGDYDIYRLNLGDGQDVIFDFESNLYRTAADSIYFGAGITASDIRLARDGASHDLTFFYGDQGDRIYIEGQFNRIHPGVFPSYNISSIEYFVFADGSAITEQQIMIMLIDLYATPGDDFVYGFDHEDRMYGDLGNDYLEGGNGNDTYLFGQGVGNDRIRDNTTNVLSGDFDRVEFSTPFNFDDLTFHRGESLHDIVIRLPGGSELTLVGQDDAYWLNSAQYFHRIEQFDFADLDGLESSFTAAELQVRYLVLATSDGADSIFGFNTNDLIVGGAGDDYLSGGNGNDTYVYNIGDGSDVIEDNNAAALADDYDVVRFGEGIEISDVEFARDLDAMNDLLVRIGTDVIRIAGTFWYPIISYLPDHIELFSFAGGDELTINEVRQILLTSTSADETLYGFSLNDDFVYSRGGGNDHLSDGLSGGSVDRLLFTDINENEVNYERSGVDLVIRIVESSPGAGDAGSVGMDIANAYGEIGVESVVFADGATRTMEDLRNVLLTGTAADETLQGFYQNDDFRYVRGGGNDVLIEDAHRGSGDRLLFTDINESEVTYERSGMNLIIRIAESAPGAGDGGSVTINVGNADAEIGVESVVFADGTNRDRLYFRDILLTGSPADGTLQGFHQSNDFRYARGGGNDIIVEDAFRGSNDRLLFTDINENMVSYVADGSDLLVTIAESSPGAGDGGSIRLDGSLHGTNERGVEAIVFADGVVRTMAEIRPLLMVSGPADEIFAGTPRSDTYRYARGGGNDQINEPAYYSSNDRLLFTDINENEVTYERNGVDLIIRIAESAPGAGDGGSVTFNVGTTNAEVGVESVVFADGTTHNRQYFRDVLLTGTSADETLQGYYQSNDFRYARGGGSDIIVEDAHAGSSDRLLFTDINESEVSYERSGMNLVIRIAESALGAGDGGSVTVNVGNADAEIGVESVVFADGTTHSRQYFRDVLLTSTAADETLQGFHQSNDFRYSRGGGNDVFVEDANRGISDRLLFTDINENEVTYERSGMNLVIRIAEGAPGAGDGGSVTINVGNADAEIGVESAVFADGTTRNRQYFRDVLLTSTSADETLPGFHQNNDFRYARGGGDDLIVEDAFRGSGDRLLFTDISESEVTYERSGDDLVVLIAESSPGASDGGSVTINVGATNAEVGVESVVFADGTTRNRQFFRDVLLTGTPANETFQGFYFSDSYRYARGGGNDIIVENSNAGTNDRLLFTDIDAHDIALARAGNDLIFLVAESATGSGDHGSVTVRNGLASGSVGVESFVFADGTIWTKAQAIDILNNSPVLAAPLANQESPEDVGVDFFLAAGTFVDPNGNPLIYSARQADGSSLPAWLAFDSAGLRFTGQPPVDFNGVLVIEVAASDGAFSARGSFQLVITPVDEVIVTTEHIVHPNGTTSDLTYFDGVLALSVQTDPLDMASWSSITSNFDATGVIADRIVLHDDGATNTQTYAGGVLALSVQADPLDVANWSSITSNFDAAGVIADRIVLYDDGATNTQTYAGGVLARSVQADPLDVANWSSITSNFDAAGVITDRIVLHDDGATNTQTYAGGVLALSVQADPLDVANWSSITSNFDATGVIADRIVLYDDGATNTQTYAGGVLALSVQADPLDVANWSSITSNFDAAGVIADRIVLYDDGATNTQTYAGGVLALSVQADPLDVANWSSITSNFDAAGVIADRIVLYDDGATNTQTYAGGVLARSVQADPLDVASWSRISTFFTEVGEMSLRIVDYDNGRLSVSGGVGDQSIGGGPYADILSGGGGADTFVFWPTGGADRVTDFTNGEDFLDLTAWNIESIADFAAAGFSVEQTGANAVLHLGVDTVTIYNFTLSQFDDSDFARAFVD